tara:strand:+ start:213 stop:506 length:294 start_codon:yes stop_codon:yes gene_type:complete
LSIVKSELIKELKKSYPNFLNQDLNKIVEIILVEMKNTLKRDEGVELRNFGTFRTNIQKASLRRNPKTGEKVNVPQKKTIKWKMSKELFKKLNNEKE